MYQDDITKYEMSSNSHALKRTLGTGNDGTTIDSSLQEFMKNTKHHLQKRINDVFAGVDMCADYHDY